MTMDNLDPAPAGTFTVVALPDMQLYAHTGTEVYDQVIRWIVEQRERQRIVFVSHLGDMVDKADRHEQWRVVRTAMRPLDECLPYGAALGNHDLMQGWRTLYDEYFPERLFTGRPWYGGSFEHSSYQLVSAAGLDFLFLQLECNARDHVLAWADEVIRRHPDRRVAVSTHCYLGRLVSGLPREERWYTPRGRLPWSRFADGNTARQMWDKCLSRHPNLFLILSGDQAFVQAMRQQATGQHGNTVHELMSDYSYASRDLRGAHPDFFRECRLPPADLLREQDYRETVLARPDFGRQRRGSMQEIKSKSGKPVPCMDGFIRLLRFVPAGNRIEVRTYSPVQDRLCLGNPVVPDPGQHRFDLEYGMMG